MLSYFKSNLWNYPIFNVLIYNENFQKTIKYLPNQNVSTTNCTKTNNSVSLIDQKWAAHQSQTNNPQRSLDSRPIIYNKCLIDAAGCSTDTFMAFWLGISVKCKFDTRSKKSKTKKITCTCWHNGPEHSVQFSNTRRSSFGAFAHHNCWLFGYFRAGWLPTNHARRNKQWSVQRNSIKTHFGEVFHFARKVSTCY